MSSTFTVADLSMAMQYMGMRFHRLVTAMKKPDWSEYRHTSWYQYFLAEVGTMERLMGAASRHPITLIVLLTAERLLTYLNDGKRSPWDILALIKSLNPHVTRIKECHVKLATIMAHAWWQNDSGKVELGYERRPLRDVIAEAAEFFAGVSNGGISLPLLINSHPSPTAECTALHTMCTEGLKDINQELSYLSKLILHSQEQMSSLEAITRSKLALQVAWVESVSKFNVAALVAATAINIGHTIATAGDPCRMCSLCLRTISRLRPVDFPSFPNLIAAEMSGTASFSSNYLLSAQLAEYMRHRVLHEMHPCTTAVPPQPLEFEVQTCIALNQMAATLAQAYRNPRTPF
ncbi:hypothetical protein BKA82DRAFT_32186 [Pisolithus tinctorius]|uniref:Uncharacterized protein n=1 Tax=Pisolithus tinctorius Marx 270 TaxID=870435 RepID=A0A0C3N925_PISTI|nr:hypothetical protein BKA82DRAFT_32186 [Pisolithus tinctorius]KIN97574.1 hypothetical protein M404DRAFT_32186 [Pisolithus tinctorius Marx 270]